MRAANGGAGFGTGYCGFGKAALAVVLLALCGSAAAARPQTDGEHLLDDLKLKSNAVLIVDQDSGEILADKNADVARPIASLTKLMTALVVLEAQQPGDELLEITRDDVDREKNTPSRLKVGTRLSRDELLLLALMASENRSTLTLSRHFPGGRRAFVARMNAKARELGMTRTRFVDPAGLMSGNVSPPRDLVKLLAAADSEPLIRDYSTRREYTVRVGKRPMKFGNSNRLIRSRAWSIGLQKTGFTNEAGRCLVMQARVANRRLAMIFLDSFGKLTRYGDASRVRQRLERDSNRKRAASADAS